MSAPVEGAIFIYETPTLYSRPLAHFLSLSFSLCHSFLLLFFFFFPPVLSLRKPFVVGLFLVSHRVFRVLTPTCSTNVRFVLLDVIETRLCPRPYKGSKMAPGSPA